MCAAKLQYEQHFTGEMRRSFASYLETKQSERETDATQEGVLQKAVDFGKVVVQVTSQQTPAPAPHEKLVVAMVTLYLIVISIILFGSFGPSTDQLIVGSVVIGNLLFFYGAPLSTIFRVLKTQNSASIHIPTMVTNTLNGTFWAAYGFAVKDHFVSVPNGIGALLGVIQFFLCFVFPRKPTVVEDDSVPAVELEGSVKDDTVHERLSSSNSHDSKPTPVENIQSNNEVVEAVKVADDTV